MVWNRAVNATLAKHERFDPFTTHNYYLMNIVKKDIEFLFHRTLIRYGSDTPEQRNQCILSVDRTLFSRQVKDAVIRKLKLHFLKLDDIDGL